MTSEIPVNLHGSVEKLLECCRDGEHGFRLASKSVDDPILRAELVQYSLQRQDFAADLKAAMHEIGDEIDDGGSLRAGLHRGWINIRQAISGHDRYAVLAECERGEDAAVATYREATLEALPAQLTGVIISQYQAIQRVHDRIRLLRDMARSL